MRNGRLNKLVKVSLLGVIAFILMFVEVATPLFPSFLKIDISDLPALVGAFALGPMAGIAIEFLKNLLHGLCGSSTAFIGELANFAVGSVVVVVASCIYGQSKTRKTAVVGLVIGTIAMSLVASVLNYFILLPLYEKVLHFPISAIVAMGNKINPNIKDLNSFVVLAILPFNLIKGVILSGLTFAIYKSVSPILYEERNRKTEFVKNN
ncbi:ECF transporter S component [Clostridium sp. P21]|uniref:Riboflavin transporter n=1 Tax=Clostridium muellerianum TaxID=2716538 RepID=A0A7Y0EDP1_9CLOT|nr:ECF transporter S component [Clostridium muellerianum]NMM61522.1 ECF transporter S component [Clostridium muellerianum]